MTEKKFITPRTYSLGFQIQNADPRFIEDWHKAIANEQRRLNEYFSRSLDHARDAKPRPRSSRWREWIAERLLRLAFRIDPDSCPW